MVEFEFLAGSEGDTKRLAAALDDCLPRSAVVGLAGTLGAGKTALVRAFAENCGVDPLDVTSPTFTLCNEYRGIRRINHFDVYRLSSADEFLDLGVDEYFADDAVTFVEWADRVAETLPQSHLMITILVETATSRRFHITTESKAMETVLRKLSSIV